MSCRNAADCVSQTGNARFFSSEASEATVGSLGRTLTSHVTRPVLLILVVLRSLDKSLHIVWILHVLERIASLQWLLLEELLVVSCMQLGRRKLVKLHV